MPANLNPPRATEPVSPAAGGPPPIKQNSAEENPGSAEVESDALEEFAPRRFLSNGHLQTVVGNFLRRHNRLPEPEERLFQVEENVQILCHCHWQPQHQSRSTVLIVHGLEGSSLSRYVIGTGSKAWDAGMNVLRMNMRTCGGTEHLSHTLYHSGLSSDVGLVVRTLIEQERLRRFGLVGYSMGGNLVLKLAGEWGNSAPAELKTVAAVSPAADISASVDAMHEKSNRIYEWRFLLSLMRRYRRKRRLLPAVFGRVSRLPRTIREFDDLITAPYCGFAGAQDYYDRATATRVIEKITVPTLVIHSTDDPFIRMLPDTRAKLVANPRVTLMETQHGGHCAFIAAPNGNDYDGRWAERQVIQFFLRHGMA
ncbi:MAG TPA: alpha/beta fold hydrolase [Candidatus Angelobacter sp.]